MDVVSQPAVEPAGKAIQHTVARTAEFRIPGEERCCGFAEIKRGQRHGIGQQCRLFQLHGMFGVGGRCADPAERVRNGFVLPLADKATAGLRSVRERCQQLHRAGPLTAIEDHEIGPAVAVVVDGEDGIG